MRFGECGVHCTIRTSTLARYRDKTAEEHKSSGFEPDDQRSGYVWEGLHAYRELRDDRVIARGQHSISYRLRAETPGNVSALPATIEGMCAPELVGNSDEFKLMVIDGE